MSNPKCGQDLHKDRMAEVGRCSGDLMICNNFNPRAKDKIKRDLYRCERHAFHIMSFDHMKHLKFVYVGKGESKKSKLSNEKVVVQDALDSLLDGAKGFAKDLESHGIKTGAPTVEIKGRRKRGRPKGSKNKLKPQSKQPSGKRGRPKGSKNRKKEHSKIKCECAPRRKRGRPVGSRNKPKLTEVESRKKRGRPKKIKN